MTNKFLNHRIWHFIQQAKMKGEDSTDFYHPVSILADCRYEELRQHLNSMGYLARSVSNSKGNSLSGLMVISNIQSI